ncbi:YiiD C-terminal domain-containing protein [Nonomuraea sp. NPDC049309]|uniref:YiiD C-terminal domain-containing protein n=1 Tax=Nonomuraea sp. NPDC049309 TaxID=3364350 RepID=UPI00371EC146
MSQDVGELLLRSVPFARTLGIVVETAEDGRAICRVPPRADLANHVGGPHAGVLFTLAESASGAAVLSLFADQLERAVPLPTTATIAFRKIATGEVRASARLAVSREDVLARLDAGERPEFDVEVEITNADGAVVSTLAVTWTLRPNRP